MWAVQLRISKDGEEISWYGPLLSSNKLLLGNSDGQVISISPFTGKLLSKLDLSEEIVASPINLGEQIILISKNSEFYNLCADIYIDKKPNQVIPHTHDLR